MSDYVPTTETVRDVYATAVGLPEAPKRETWFDRWLAEHDEQVRREAEQRGAAEALEVFQNMSDKMGEAVAFDVLATPHGEAEYPVSDFREKLEEAIGQVSDDMELVPKDWYENHADQIEGAQDHE